MTEPSPTMKSIQTRLKRIRQQAEHLNSSHRSNQYLSKYSNHYQKPSSAANYLNSQTRRNYWNSMNENTQTNPVKTQINTTRTLPPYSPRSRNKKV